MKIYMINCSRCVENQIKQIVLEKKIGTVAKMPDNWEETFSQGVKAESEVILTELTQKSLRYMQKIKETSPEAIVVMLSAVNDVETIKTAYGMGAEFVLHSPVNEIELEHILQNIEMSGMMRWLLSRTKTDSFNLSAAKVQVDDEPKSCDLKSHYYIQRLKRILQEIGIFSESGCKDMIRIAEYLIEHDINFGDMTLNELCDRLGEKTKNVEQRIRRAALAGLTNLAGRGLDDYADPVFNEYVGKLYHFEQIKKETDYIIGKSEKHGNVRIRKFLTVLFEYCEEGSRQGF